MRNTMVKKTFMTLALLFAAEGLNANPVVIEHDADEPIFYTTGIKQDEYQRKVVFDANGGLLYDGVSKTNRLELAVTSISGARTTGFLVGDKRRGLPRKLRIFETDEMRRKKHAAIFPLRRPVFSTGDFPIPVMDGYEFEGWYTKAVGGIKVVPGANYLEIFPERDENVISSRNVVLYAHWRHKGWGQEKFTWELYRWLAKDDGNIVFSPHGVGGICALMAAGARGDTAKAFVKTLGLPTTEIDEIASLFCRDNYEMDFSWAAEASGFWMPDGPFERNNSKTTRYDDRYYTFGNGDSPHTEYCYRWFNRVEVCDINIQEDPIIRRGRECFQLLYSDKIMIVGEDDPNDHRIDICNVISQHVRFGPVVNEVRGKNSFKKADGALVDVNFINGEVNARLCRDKEFSAISIPCALFHPGIAEREGSLEMWVIMPNGGVGLSRIEELLSEKFIREVGQKLSEEMGVNLSMPFLHVKNAHKLNAALCGIGLGVAFDPGAADFSGLGCSVTNANHLSDVRHGADLFVYGAGDENDGLVKRAWRGLASCTGPSPQSFAVDRAFVFLIKNKETGSIYFAGRVVDPAAVIGVVSDKSRWCGIASGFSWSFFESSGREAGPMCWSFEIGDGSSLFFEEKDFDWGTEHIGRLHEPTDYHKEVYNGGKNDEEI